MDLLGRADLNCDTLYRMRSFLQIMGHGKIKGEERAPLHRRGGRCNAMEDSPKKNFKDNALDSRTAWGKLEIQKNKKEVILPLNYKEPMDGYQRGGGWVDG